MKDEIKEILNRLFVYRNENNKMKYQPEDILTIDDVWLLLDCITNLQESEAYYYGQYKDYKSRNEKAIEYIKEHQRKDEFLNLNEWETRDLLNILNGGDEEC